MFHSFEDTPILFDEYRPSKEKLNGFRRRLLTVEPNLLIADNEEEGTEQDWDDIYFIMPNEEKVICLIPDHYEINVPRIFVLSDEKDYEMSNTEIFSFLSIVYDKKLGYQLLDKKFTLGEELTGLIFNIRYYLEHKDVEPEPEIVNHYDNYNTGERKRYYDAPTIDVDEALHLVQLVLSTVYNYQGEYKFTAQDLELLS